MAPRRRGRQNGDRAKRSDPAQIAFDYHVLEATRADNALDAPASKTKPKLGSTDNTPRGPLRESAVTDADTAFLQQRLLENARARQGGCRKHSRRHASASLPWDAAARAGLLRSKRNTRHSFSRTPRHFACFVDKAPATVPQAVRHCTRSKFPFFTSPRPMLQEDQMPSAKRAAYRRQQVRSLSIAKVDFTGQSRREPSAVQIKPVVGYHQAPPVSSNKAIVVAIDRSSSNKCRLVILSSSRASTETRALKMRHQ